MGVEGGEMSCFICKAHWTEKTPHENLLTKPSMSQTGRAAAGFVRENINVSKTYRTFKKWDEDWFYLFFKVQAKVKKNNLLINICQWNVQSTEVTPTSTQSGEMLLGSKFIFWRLEGRNGPDSPGAHVYIGVRTLTWKADIERNS